MDRFLMIKVERNNGNTNTGMMLPSYSSQSSIWKIWKMEKWTKTGKLPSDASINSRCHPNNISMMLILMLTITGYTFKAS